MSSVAGPRQPVDGPPPPTAAILGGGYRLIIDTLARTAAPAKIPLGILMALVGTAFFIWLLASSNRGWS